MSKKLKIIFAGTPEIARLCLEKILKAEFNVELVLTQPDRPAGRGMKLTSSPVKEFAIQNGIEVFQPISFKNNIEAIEKIKSIQADIMVVVAYGLILPQSVLNMPYMGCVNIHVSLLPRHRGAAPIQRAILEGDKVSGVTIMQMDSGLDTGDILLCEEEIIEESETSSTLHDKLALRGARMVVKYLTNYAEIKPSKQSEIGATYATKITKAEAQINWNEDANLIERKVRGYNPYPVAYTFMDSKLIKIWHSRVANYMTNLAVGKIINYQDDYIAISCGNGSVLEILELQLAGEKRKLASLFAQYHTKLDKFSYIEKG